MRKAIPTMFVAALLAGGSVGAAVAQGAGAGGGAGGSAGAGAEQRVARQRVLAATVERPERVPVEEAQQALG